MEEIFVIRIVVLFVVVVFSFIVFKILLYLQSNVRYSSKSRSLSRWQWQTLPWSILFTQEYLWTALY